jgi:DNA recombination protein RmuC
MTRDAFFALPPMPAIADPLLMSAVVAAAFAIGVAIAWLLLRTRLRGAEAAGRASRDADVAQLGAERDALLDALQRLQREHDAALRELEAGRGRIVDLSAERATLAGRLERLTQIEAELVERRAESMRLLEARQRAEQQTTAMATRLQEQQHAAQERLALAEQSAQERIALLERVREEFADRFKVLAGELLEEKGRRFAEQNQQNIGTLLDPLREQLGEFRKTVADVYDKESRERQLLKAEIDSLKNLNQRISADAISLTQALKGDSKARGAWGEMVLERLLEMAGLQEGRQFDTQASFAAEGGRQRPDVIVHLPDDKDIVVDAKVSLLAWERFVAAGDDVERAAAMRDHLAAVRRHIDDLSGKDYSGIPRLRTLDFVLMFVPIEAAFVEAVRVDDRLYGYALAKNVSIVSPSTLLATLRTVSHLWRIEQRNVNALEYARVAAQLHDNFATLIEGIQEVGLRLDRARSAHDGLLRRLTEGGRGSVLLQVQRLQELGADAKKKLPRELLERAGARVEDVEGERESAEPAAAAAQLPLDVSVGEAPANE